VSTCRLQTGQGQAGILSGLARGNKALLWRAMGIFLLCQTLTVRAKLVELTPCGHRSDKNRIYTAWELKQNLKHCKQLRKRYLQTEKLKKKCSKQLTKYTFR
jgi:hypothetical protein